MKGPKKDSPGKFRRRPHISGDLAGEFRRKSADARTQAPVFRRICQRGKRRPEIVINSDKKGVSAEAARFAGHEDQTSEEQVAGRVAGAARRFNRSVGILGS